MSNSILGAFYKFKLGGDGSPTVPTAPLDSVTHFNGDSTVPMPTSTGGAVGMTHLTGDSTEASMPSGDAVGITRPTEASMPSGDAVGPMYFDSKPQPPDTTVGAIYTPIDDKFKPPDMTVEAPYIPTNS